MLQVKISKAIRTTKNHLNKLETIGIRTVRDFLLYFPRTYEDERQLNRIIDLKIGQNNTIKGVLSNIVSKRSRMGKLLTYALLTDETGSVEAVWFNQPHLTNLLRAGMQVILSGSVKFDFGKVSLVNPKYEMVGAKQIHTSRIVPVYHETEGITSKWFREKLYYLLPFADLFQEYMPEEIIKNQNLMSYTQAVKAIHFPVDEEELEKAKERLAFDELFIIQLSILQRRSQWLFSSKNNLKKIIVDKELLNSFLSSLPFSLTSAQVKALTEIIDDFDHDYPMLRLLQGDVGSGKTVVAVAAALCAIKSGYQVALMVPTEILAKQHYLSIARLLQDHSVKIQLLTGSLTLKKKKEVSALIAAGLVDLAIGTHALIQEDIGFKNLGLAIIDEQHRFGVKQRDKLKAHGLPHLLNLSATPIPRTLAMTIYGDQDLSIIDELPPGRQKIITRIVPEYKRHEAYLWIRDQVQKGRQVYIICPLIDESDVLQLKSVITEFERLRDSIFPDLKLGLLHGKLKQAEKDEVMDAFADNKISILVSTSVVEVGIDVPNATIMIIEGAERFGLSQLHQFRGRVGRGVHQSYCFLFPSKESAEINKRLKAMCEHHSGFKLSEIDLELRGPGEIYGVRQSGLPDLKMASLNDSELIERARKEALKIITLDSELMSFHRLREKIAQIRGDDK